MFHRFYSRSCSPLLEAPAILRLKRQQHPRDLLPKTFFVSSQLKYVAAIDSQLRHFDMISRYLSIQCLLPSVRRKRSAALRLVFHLLGGIETRRHTIVTSPDWTGTTLAGRGRIVTPAIVGIPREYAKISSFGVDPAGTMRLSSAPESDGAQYHRVHSRVCSL